MEVKELDPVTGRETTGHVWNGIKELETPIPKVVIWFIIVTHLFALLWWVLMPSWPLFNSYTKGILGTDQKIEVEEALAVGAAKRADWTSKIASMGWQEIQTNDALMARVRDSGHQLFGDNCAACHGANAMGGNGYPDLIDASWIWGGAPETIMETIRIGVNSASEESRISQMPAFGRDGMLDRTQVENVALFVRSLSNPDMATAGNVARLEAGKDVFANNCVACHGEDAQGMTDLGAPNLADSHWLYGGDIATITTTIYGGRAGHMPAWGERLSPVEIKTLALYVTDLGLPGKETKQ